MNSFLYGSKVFLRNRISVHLTDEINATAPFQGLQDQPDMTEVLLLTQLFFETPFNLNFFLYGLTVDHPGLSDVDMGVELTEEPVNDDLEMKLTHAR